VDQDGQTLDVLVQKQRTAKAAKRVFRQLLEGLRYVSRVLVTDKLGSYTVARQELMPAVEHRRAGERTTARSALINSRASASGA
jgi:putative transposase